MGGPGGDANFVSSSPAQVVTTVASPNSGQFSIGAVPSAYATGAGEPVASVQNEAGDFVQPTDAAVQAGLGHVTPGAQGLDDINPEAVDPTAYFPDILSYALAPTTTNAPASSGADSTLAQFLCYAIGPSGQEEAMHIDGGSLSPQLESQAVSDIESIPGAPPANNCG